MSTSGAVHVGSIPIDFPTEFVQLVHFHDFVNLPTVKGKRVNSPAFSCAGRKWRLAVYPGGRENSEDGNLGVGLQNMAASKITAAFEFFLKASNILNNKSKKMRLTLKGRSRTVWDFAREEIVHEGVLNNGTLTFEVRIRPDPEYWCNTVKVHKSLSENMLALFLRDNNKDVAFEVKGETISAHRVVLQAQVPGLDELCETYDMTNPVPIDDVEPSTFKLMIEYLYDKTIDVDEWKDQSSYLIDPDKHSKSILRAAGKYGLTTLKNEAEAWYLKFHKLEVDNVIDNLLYADGNHLLLLKEATMKFIVENSEGVVASDSYKEFLSKSPTLLNEVVLALSKKLSLKRE